MREEEARVIAKRAMKIAIACVFITLLLGLLILYALLNQISATAQMSKEIREIKALEERKANNTNPQVKDNL